MISVVVGTASIFLENQSTMTRTALLPFDSGSGPIMSTETICQGLDGTLLGTRGAAGLVHLGFEH